MTTNPNNSFTNVSNLVGQVPTVNVADLNLVNSTVDEVVANKVLLTEAHLTTKDVSMSAVEITNAGGSAAVALTGNDTKGTLDVNTGATVTTGAIVKIKVTFNEAYENAPVVIVKIGKAGLDGQSWYVTSTTTDFTINIPWNTSSETAWSMNYLVVGLE
jgi:hypothetical protein